MISLVGFSGYARSGKDSAAQALIGSGGWRRAAFADALKRDDALAALENSWMHNGGDCLDASLFSDPVLKEKFRPFMVEYGRAMRNLDPEYWIRRAFFDMSYSDCREGSPLRFAVTDVRYENEARAIRSRGGKVIGITRPGTGPANAEEADSIPFVQPDALISNDGGLSRLHAKVFDIIHRWDLSGGPA